MSRIELSAVVERMLDLHYKERIDWRLIDSIGDTPIPTDYLRKSVITYDEFEQYMLRDGFVQSAPTVKAKWKILVASGVISNVTKNRAVIDLSVVKSGLREASRIPFYSSLYESEKKNEKKMCKKNVCEESA